MEKINLLFSIDKNYVEKFLDVLLSIKYNNDYFLNVYLMYDYLEDRDIERINSFFDSCINGKINFIYFNDQEFSFPNYIKYISKVTYYRLFFPFVEKDNLDRILYLDCDLVCCGDLLDLYKSDFENNIILAAENMLINKRKHYSKIWNKRLGLPDDNIYVNAGVLLINVSKYKEEVNKDDIIKFIDSNRNILIFQDQDVINKYFYGKIKNIDNKYNYQINAVDFNKEMNGNVIVHYSESVKPWDMKYEDVRKAVPYYEFLKKKGDIVTLEFLIKHHSDNYKDLLLREYCDWRGW